MAGAPSAVIRPATTRLRRGGVDVVVEDDVDVHADVEVVHDVAGLPARAKHFSSSVRTPSNMPGLKKLAGNQPSATAIIAETSPGLAQLLGLVFQRADQGRPCSAWLASSLLLPSPAVTRPPDIAGKGLVAHRRDAGERPVTAAT
jgi:hypothetical protein